MPSADLESAARIVYDEYLSEAGSMYVDGDSDYTRLLDWATMEMATLESAGVSDFAENGVSVSSWYSVVDFNLSARDDDSVTVAACVDVAGVRLTGPDGVDVTPVDREPLVALNLRFELSADAALLLDAQDPWNPADEPSPCPA